MPTADQTRDRVLAIIAAIPAGRVTTYGAIARKLRTTPRQVARVLASFSSEESQTLPWFRVVAANGVVSTIKLGTIGRQQIAMLEADGVPVSPRNKIIDFKTFVWWTE
jgi:methylated-DNA-protein-cysteine methyltransferase-like protein